MQRQSLGSPSLKLHGHGVVEAKGDSLTVEEQKRKDQASSLADDEEHKAQKPHQKSPTRPERFVHLIPLLTFICFLILYLSSHDPSQKELAQFNGFNRPSKRSDSTTINEFGRALEVEKGDILAIRSLRNLQEMDSGNSGYRLPRKIGDF